MEVLHADGIFARIHDELAGSDVPFGQFRASDYRPELIQLARDVWQTRVHTEFRSIQVMARLLSEVLGAGDPIEVWSGIADAIIDEIRHTALCVGMVEALGVRATLPEPLVDDENPEFLALPMAQRGLSTAISMLAISETLSTGYIADLQSRCTDPVVQAVLDRTLADEETHHEFGWAYVDASMARFDTDPNSDAMAMWRMVTEVTLDPHFARAQENLRDVPPTRRLLEQWPEPELAALGLLSPQREALIFEKTWRETLAPALSARGLV